MKLFNYFILATFLLFCVIGCEDRDRPLPQGVAILSLPQKLHLVELPHRALPLWRFESTQKPALVLLSADSLLQPIPEKLQRQVRNLVLSGTKQELIDHGPFRAETAIMPGQTVKAALSAELFSQVVWVIPQSEAGQKIDFAATRKALFESGAIDDYDLQSLETTDSGFKGTVAGTPFVAILSSHLPELKLDMPAVVHLDLTFFTGLYRNEIRTPIYPLIINQLKRLQASGIRTLATTLSLNSLIGQTPLSLRFIGQTIKTLFDNPDLFTRSAPHSWELRAKALYLETFFQPEKQLDIARQLVELEPDNASHRYALYQALKLSKMNLEAFESLDRAITLDPAYSREYMLLATQSYQGGDFDATITHYRAALQAYPQDITVKINLAKALSDAKRNDECQALVTELSRLNWTDSYYPDIEPFLDSLVPEQSSQP